MSSQTAPQKRVTIHELKRMKGAGERIAVVTAYDATGARLVDRGGADVVLVGDSLGMVVQGHESTLPVTLDQMVYHSAMVRRGLSRAGSRAHLVGDMPFGSYQASADEAVKAALRLVAEGGVEAVKLEGGADFAEVIARIVRAGIPVMGHIGLTPQAINALGKVRVQGKTREQARALLHDALAVQEAGAFAIVLELVPAQLAAAITARLRIPTIGIGAGPGCSGQVQVITDVLGLGSFVPRHARPFADLRGTILAAVAAYRAEVEAGSFPGEAQATRMDDTVLDEVLGRAAVDRPGTEDAVRGGIPLDRDL